jgi:ABC-type dipeptide/oligopeptide/nickel transport system permease subunit
MLIGVCVAFFSTGIAATVGSISGYFGGWRDRALMWIVDLLLVVPNVASILIIDAALNVAVAILAETGLSFLGFGIQPPDVSLGTLIADGTQSAITFPWVFLFPRAYWC